MNCCRETIKMGVPPGNRRVLDSVLEQYVAGSDTRGRQEGRPYYGLRGCARWTIFMKSSGY
jgi:hypothetical protein